MICSVQTPPSPQIPLGNHQAPPSGEPQTHSHSPTPAPLPALPCRTPPSSLSEGGDPALSCGQTTGPVHAGTLIGGGGPPALFSPTAYDCPRLPQKHKPTACFSLFQLGSTERAAQLLPLQHHSPHKGTLLAPPCLLPQGKAHPLNPRRAWTLRSTFPLAFSVYPFSLPSPSHLHFARTPKTQGQHQTRTPSEVKGGRAEVTPLHWPTMSKTNFRVAL